MENQQKIVCPETNYRVRFGNRPQRTFAVSILDRNGAPNLIGNKVDAVMSQSVPLSRN